MRLFLVHVDLTLVERVSSPSFTRRIVYNGIGYVYVEALPVHALLE